MTRLVAAIAVVLMLCSAASAAQVWVPGCAYYPYGVAPAYDYGYAAPAAYPARAYYRAPAYYYRAPAVVYAAPVPVRARVYYGYPPPRRAVWGVVPY